MTTQEKYVIFYLLVTLFQQYQGIQLFSITYKYIQLKKNHIRCLCNLDGIPEKFFFQEKMF